MSPTRQPGCEFCEIVARGEPARVVLRTSEVVAFFPDEPATMGHTLLIPTRHFQDIWALDERTAGWLAHASLRLARAIRKALVPEGLNIIQSNGEAASQTVQHVHVHLVPRWSGDAMGPIWPSDTTWTAASKNRTMRMIRGALEEQP